MLTICIQTSYDQNVQLILKSYLPVVYGTPLTRQFLLCLYQAREVGDHEKVLGYIDFDSFSTYMNCSDSEVFIVIFISILFAK